MIRFPWTQRICQSYIGIGLNLLVHLSLFSESEDCSQDALISNFPQLILTQTLERFEIPRKDWPAISHDLAEKDKVFIQELEDKAAKITPNPLQDPQQRQVALKLFREALYNSFSQVMKTHGIADDKKIQAMLEDLQQRKAKEFAKCLRVQQPDHPTPIAPPSSRPLEVSPEAEP